MSVHGAVAVYIKRKILFPLKSLDCFNFKDRFAGSGSTLKETRVWTTY